MEKPVDANGVRLPRRLYPQFQHGAKKMRGWCSQLSLLKREIAEEAGYRFGEDIDVVEVRDAIDAAMESIQKSIPMYRCKCVTLDCPICGGREWLSLRQGRRGLKLEPR